MNYRKGNHNDVEKLRALGINSWTEYKNNLTPENWNTLSNIVKDPNTYEELLKQSECIICEDEDRNIIGMAFIVPSGNPTEIYDEKWCYIRFVSVNPEYRGKRIGEVLTNKCIEIAKKNNEQIMALHTSEIMGSARHIYEKIGFRILKELEPKFGVKYWLYTMGLD